MSQGKLRNSDKPFCFAFNPELCIQNIINSYVSVDNFKIMHHMYPVSKGDQLCPLGFHPQVRWPTRCKRCFRDYKEHGGKRGDDVASSSPSLSDFSVRSRESNTNSDRNSGRNWTSTSNLSSFNNSSNNEGGKFTCFNARNLEYRISDLMYLNFLIKYSSSCANKTAVVMDIHTRSR